jgi:hypothetical protein
MMKHHTFFTAAVLPLSENYAKYGGKAGIGSVLHNENVVAFLLIQKCCESHQGRVKCGDHRAIHSLCIYIF